MRRFERGCLVFLTVFMLLSCFGCGKSETNENTGDTTETTSASESGTKTASETVPYTDLLLDPPLANYYALIFNYLDHTVPRYYDKEPQWQWVSKLEETDLAYFRATVSVTEADGAVRFELRVTDRIAGRFENGDVFYLDDPASETADILKDYGDAVFLLWEPGGGANAIRGFENHLSYRIWPIKDGRLDLGRISTIPEDPNNKNPWKINTWDFGRWKPGLDRYFDRDKPFITDGEDAEEAIVKVKHRLSFGVGY